jgi:hypothetical protein
LIFKPLTIEEISSGIKQIKRIGRNTKSGTWYNKKPKKSIHIQSWKNFAIFHALLALPKEQRNNITIDKVENHVIVMPQIRRVEPPVEGQNVENVLVEDNEINAGNEVIELPINPINISHNAKGCGCIGGFTVGFWVGFVAGMVEGLLDLLDFTDFADSESESETTLWVSNGRSLKSSWAFAFWFCFSRLDFFYFTVLLIFNCTPCYCSQICHYRCCCRSYFWLLLMGDKTDIVRHRFVSPIYSTLHKSL